MKKLLSICFLSILLSFAGFVGHAQTESQCCFWLQNMQPDTLTDIVNAPSGDGTVVLDNAMNRAWVGNTDTYVIRFENTCGLDANTQVSIEWELYDNGNLINGNLDEYCTFKILSQYDRLANINDGYVGGKVLNGQGYCDEANHIEGYPGAMRTLWGQTSHENIGYTNFGDDYINMDYFFLPYFENNETKIVITWKQVGDYSLKVSLRERLGGTPYPTLYWDETQQAMIGGHQSTCGRILASDSIHYLVTGDDTKEICEQGSLTYGMPPYEFQGQPESDEHFNVIFGYVECDHFITDSLIDLHLYYRRNPVVSVAQDNFEICQNSENLNFDYIQSFVSLDATPTQGNPTPSITWSNDGNEFAETIEFYTKPGTYTYYVRQTNTYNNFGEEIICDGEPHAITVVVLPIYKPTVNPNGYACFGEEVNLDDFLTPREGFKYFWSDNLEDLANGVEHMQANTDFDFDTTITYYVYGSYKDCFDLDSFSTVDITVYGLPKVEFTQEPTPVCEGTNVTIKATELENATYAWSNDMEGNPITFVVDKDDDFDLSVIVTQDHIVADEIVATCQQLHTTTVEVNPMPLVPTVEQERYDFCIDDESDHVLKATPGEHGTTCIWYLNGEVVDTTLEYTIPEEVIPTTNADAVVTYIIKSYNDETGCFNPDDYATIAVHFHATPVIELSKAFEDPICPQNTEVRINSSVVTPNCDNDEVDYAWTIDGVEDATTTEYIDVAITEDECNVTHTIGLTATNYYGCSNTASIEFIVKDDVAPVITTVLADTIESIHAEGCRYLVPNFAIHCEATDNCSEVTYTQEPAANTPIYENTEVVVYATDHCGNNSSISTVVTVPDKVLQVEIVANDSSFCLGGSTRLKAYDLYCDTTVTYYWNGNTVGGEDPFIYVTPTEAGEVVYHVKIVDVFGCIAEDDITLTVHRLPEADDIEFANAPNTYCDNADNIYDGKIIVSNLTEGYMYKRHEDPIWHEADYEYEGLYQDEYSIDLQSEHGCIKENAAIAVVGVNLEFPEAEIITNPNHACDPNQYDGQIIITNPQAGHVYTLVGSTKTFAEDEGTLIIDDLQDGIYTVHQATDKYCEYTNDHVVVIRDVFYPGFDQDDAIVEPYSDCEEANGALIILERFPDFTYSFHGTSFVYQPGVDAAFRGLTAFTDTLFVTTPLGCTDTLIYTIDDLTLELDTPNVTATPNHNCKDEKDGSIIVTDPQVGFTYELNGEVVNCTELGQEVIFSGLKAATYSLQFTTDHHCVGTVDNIVVEDDIENIIAPALTTKNDDYCVGSNGEITVDNWNEAYDYTLSSDPDAELTADHKFVGLSGSASYTVTATNLTTGCFTTSESVTIDDVIDNYVMNLVPTHNTNCVNENGSITVTNDNHADYEYSLNDGDYQASNVFNNLTAGNYVITAKNITTGCEFTAKTKIFDNITYPEVELTSTANTKCFGDKDGTITVVTPQSDAYNYEFIGLAGVVLPEANFVNYTMTKVDGGNYTVNVTDIATGCVTSEEIVVANNNAGIPSITVEPMNGDFCINVPSVLTAQATNGVAGDSFTYEWFEGETSLNITTPTYTVNLATPGTYTYIVEATSTTTQCKSAVEVTFTVHDNPVITLTKDKVIVDGETEACDNITSIEFGVAEDYVSYSWNTPAGVFNAQSFDLNEALAGDYKVTVTDQYGCMNNAQVELIVNPTFAITVLDAGCVDETGHYTYKDRDFEFDYNHSVKASGWNVHTFIENLTTINGCDSVVTNIVTLMDKPTIEWHGEEGITKAHCENDVLDFDYTVYFNNNEEEAQQIWWIGNDQNDVFDPTAPLTVDMNGKYIHFLASNTCGAAQDSFLLIVNAGPTVDELDVEPIVCDNDAFFAAPAYNGNADPSTIVTTTWQISTDNVTFTDIPTPTNFNYDAHNGKYFRFAVRACGEATSNAVLVKVNKPIEATVADLTICKEFATIDLEDIDITYQVKTSDDFNITLYVNGTQKDFPHVFTEAGSYTCKLMFDLCSDTYSNVFTIKVTDKPSTAPIKDRSFCVNEYQYSNTFVAPTINNNGSNVTESGWYIQRGENWILIPATSNDFITVTDNGNKIRFQAENACGISYSNEATLHLTDIPEITGTIEPLDVCEGETFTYSDLTIAHDDIVTLDDAYYEYQLAGETSWNKIAVGDEIIKAMDGASLRYHVHNGCGDDTTDIVNITVTDTAYLVVNSYVDANICKSATAAFDVTYKYDNVLNVASTEGVNCVEGAITTDNVYTNLEFTVSFDDDAVIGNNSITITSIGCNNEVKTETITFTLSDVPTITLTDPAVVCEGTTLTPVFTIDTNFSDVTSSTFEWVDAVMATAWTGNSIITDRTMNEKEARLIVTNACGSDTATFTVLVDYIDLTVSAPTSPVCAAANFALDAESNVALSIEDLQFEGAPTTVVTPSYDETAKEFTFLGHESLTFGTLTGKVVTATNACPAEEQTFAIQVETTPFITFTDFDPNHVYCKGETFTPTFDFNENAFDHATVEGPKFYADIEGTTPLTEQTSGNYLITGYENIEAHATLQNNCGIAQTETIILKVAGDVKVPAIVAQAACENSPLIDFIVNTPALPVIANVNPEDVTDVYQIFNGTDWVDADLETTLITTTMNKIRRFVKTTPCDYVFTSDEVELTVKTAPQFNLDPISGDPVSVDRYICDGTTIESLEYPAHFGTVIDSTWMIVGPNNDTLMDVTTSMVLDREKYNNGVIYCIISNECGADTVKGEFVIYALPEPTTDDASVCIDEEFTLDAVSTTPGTYRWLIGDDVIGTESSLTYNFVSTPYVTQDVNYITITLEQTDNHGCVGTYNATVRVSDNSEFIFTDMDGNRIYDLNTETGVVNPQYKVTFDHHCMEFDTMVYLEVRLYRNDELLQYGNIEASNNLDSCLMPKTLDENGTQSFWYMANEIQWKTAGQNTNILSDITYYKNREVEASLRVDGGFHYPNSPMANVISSNVYDELYLHFLINRPITETVVPFRLPGEYKIVYRLMSSSSKNYFETLYKNEYFNTDLRIGGHAFHNPGMILKELATDSIMIHVSGDPVAYDNAIAPQPAPVMTTTSEEPTMEIYPNPARETINVNISGVEGNSMFTISDLSGRVLNSQNLDIPVGMNYTHRQSITDLVPGIYLVTVKNDNAVVTRKLVISK